MITRFLAALIFVFFNIVLNAQDTLPGFKASRFGNRVIVSWVNKMWNVAQINVQQSRDSLVGYKTVVSIIDPKLEQNGASLTNVIDTSLFYRLFILQEGGNFVFSRARRAITDTTNAPEKFGIRNVQGPTIPVDSMLLNSKPGYTPSALVYLDWNRYVTVNLPQNGLLFEYSVHFSFENGPKLFALKNLKEKYFKIDKANFLKSGWFQFEIYKNQELVEKNLIYIYKEF